MSKYQQYKTHDDGLFAFEEFENTNVQYKGLQRIQTLQDILQKKSRSKTPKKSPNLYNQVQQKPNTKQQKQKIEEKVTPSQYTKLSEKLLQNVMENPQLRVSTLVQNHHQDSNYFSSQVPTYQYSINKRDGNFVASDQKKQSYRLSTENSNQKAPIQPLKESLKMEFIPQNRQATLSDSETFQQNQNNFLQKKQEKIKILGQYLQEQELDECKQKPQISSKSKILANKQNSDSNVVDRLNKKKKVVEVQLYPDEKFQPQISEKSQKLKREQKVELMLYQDAQRRQKQKQITVQNIQQQVALDSVYKQNRKSQIAFIKKFIREFEQVCDKIQLANKSDFLTYIEMQDVISNLGFLQNNDNVNRTAIFKVWNELNGQLHQLILKRNLILFLLAVQKLCYNKLQLNKIDISKIKKLDKRLEETLLSSSKLLQDSSLFKSPLHERASIENTSLYPKQSDNFDIFGNLSLTYEDVDNIHKSHKNLYLNRLTNRPTSSIPQTQDDHTYHPQIGNFSQNLADSRRQKIIQHIKNNETQNVKIDLFQILCYQKQQTLQQNEINKQIQEDQEVSECSFRPTTKDFAKVQSLFNSNRKQHETEEDFHLSKPQTSKQKVGGIHRTLALYSLARPRKERRDKESELIEYERDCNECTFTPEIKIRQYTQNDTSKSFTSIRSAQKEIARVQKGRLNSSVRKEINQKGNTQNQKKIKQIHHKVELELAPSVRSRRKSSEPLYKQSYRPGSKISDDQGLSKEQQQKEDEYDEQPKQAKKPVFQKILDEDRVPLLFVDVNIQEGQSSRIVVYEGDDSETLANKFSIEHNLDSSMKQKLKELLDVQINSLLAKIDEEVGSEDEAEDDEYQ